MLNSETKNDPTAELILEIEKDQCASLSKLKFNDTIKYIYNPLSYAKETHENYTRTYCCGEKPVLFLGMNPGPFGMAQNGVPFGDTRYVVNWLKIKGNVSKPEREHPRRIIQGLSCRRSEVSGNRFWSFLEEVCGKPENFFNKCYVHNYFPFSLMTASGKNVTPPDLKLDERNILIEICDKSLYEVLKLLKVKIVVGVGKFAEVRASKVVQSNQMSDVTVTGIMHPSPINPAANKGWKEIALQQLEMGGVLNYLTISNQDRTCL